MLALTTKYRPSRLTELRGQPRVLHALRSYMAAPCSKAFLFHGETGTGKTSAAYALAGELGVDVAHEELGGFFKISSGRQTVGALDYVVNLLRFCPRFGSGWRFVMVNEADMMGAKVEGNWLDILEERPERVVFCFTSNYLTEFTPRFAKRCARIAFTHEGEATRRAVESLIADVWQRETGKGRAPTMRDLGLSETGPYDFREALENLEPFVNRARQLACA